MRRQHVLALVLVCGLSAPAAAEVAGKADASVFDGPPAPMAPRLREGLPAPGGPMRLLTVEERVGVPRRGELVRVPLFFHEGECADPGALALFAADDAKRTRPIPCQADDVRRDPSGKVSRMHLYFAADLEPWQRRQFHLVPGPSAGAGLAAVAVTENAGRVTLAGDDLRVTFLSEGPQAGAIAAIDTTLGKVAVRGVLGPRLTLVRQAGDCKVLRSTPISYADPSTLEVRDLRWGAGPLFAKLVVRIGPRGKPDAAEFTYLVPRKGAEFVQTERLVAEGPDTAEVVGAADHVLLAGQLALGEAADQQVAQVPAGLRRLTRSEHGHTLAALASAKAGLSLLPVPYTQMGVGGIKVTDGGEVLVLGPATFRRNPAGNSRTLRAFWGQVRYVFTKATAEEDLWEVGRRHFQSLVAVVDEPGLAPDDFHAAAAEAVKEFYKIKYWGRGWMQSAAMLYLEGKPDGLKKLLEKSPKEAETAVEYWLPAPPAPPPPSPAAVQKPPAKPGPGRLDPYMVTYALSGAVPLAAWLLPEERIDRVCLAVGRGQRQLNGRVDEQGFPYVNCFATALNMQVGSYLMGIHAGRKLGDADLAQFYRDCARTAPVLGVYGRGQRPYTGCIKGAGPSDLLYEALSDHWLRTIELACGEDLWLHPAVFGRYFDCVDVTADLQHRDVGDPGTKPPSWWRANFFRGQSHDHRWESWDAAPYVGLFARAGGEVPAGLTEACYFLRHRAGRDVNWSELLPIFLADVNLREGLRRYRPPPAPPLPAGVEVKSAAGANVVLWKAAAGDILGYRVYRADRMGGPWTLVNSPYAARPAPLVQGTTFTDAEGKTGQVYFVAAVDTMRRESRWFPDEPLPEAGRDAGR